MASALPRTFLHRLVRSRSCRVVHALALDNLSSDNGTGAPAGWNWILSL